MDHKDSNLTAKRLRRVTRYSMVQDAPEAVSLKLNLKDM